MHVPCPWANQFNITYNFNRLKPNYFIVFFGNQAEKYVANLDTSTVYTTAIDSGGITNVISISGYISLITF